MRTDSFSSDLFRLASPFPMGSRGRIDIPATRWPLSENGTGDESPLVWTINRGVVVLRPKPPFADWVRSLDSEPVDEERILTISTAFLIPDFDFVRESWDWIEDNYELFFDVALADWYLEPSRWPQERDWKMFKEWFHIEFIDAAWDLVDEPLSSDFEQELGDE
jgi:hypothetical protein